MSDPYLPAEILDHVVDHLHDTPDALRNCCLVCKSWIPRARMHLFADIRFHTVEDLESWKVTFPDPSTSPMCYAKTLAIDCPSSDAEVGGWIGGFSRVVHLEVRSHRFPGDLVPFYGFSPAIKSLHMIFDVPPPPCAFDLVLSFPLLENLTVKIFFESSASARDFDWPPPATQPSNPPTLTGSLELYLRGGMKHITHRLLSFPGGIHFWKLTLTWCREGDLTLLTALVGECSHTLESLNITCSILGTDISAPTPAPIIYFCFQLSQGQLRSTSQKQQNLKMWCSASKQRVLNVLPRHFRPSHPNIEIFDKSRFMCFPSSMPASHKTLGSGWVLTISWSDSRSRIRSA